MRTLRWVAVALVASFVPLHAFALFQLRPGWTKFMVWINSASNPAALDSIVADAGGQIVWRYPAARLVYIPETQRSTVTQRANAEQMTVYPPLDELIYLPGGPIDPARGVPPEVPASQKTFSYPAGQPGTYVVQFIGPLAAEWMDEIRVTGATVVQYFHENAYHIAATPEQAMTIAESAHIQFLDFLHPFEKGPARDWRPSVRYDVRVYVSNVGGATDATLEEIRSVAETTTTLPDSPAQFALDLRFRGEDAQRIARLPLVNLLAFNRESLPLTRAAVPRQAPAGAQIILSGRRFESGATVLFGGVPSPHVEFLGADRLRVEVPPGLPDVPLDLLVKLPKNKNQVFLAGGPTSFRASTGISRTTVIRGDVLTADALLCEFLSPCYESGQIRWLDGDANLFMASSSDVDVPTTLFVDPEGSVNLVSARRVVRYDGHGESAGAGPQWAIGAAAVVFDGDGNAIVVKDNQVSRYHPDGPLLGSGTLGAGVKATAADLDVDQCTLYTALGRSITAYDVCTNHPGPPPFIFRDSPITALRILPDRTLLIADFQGVHNVTLSGTVLVSKLAGNGGGMGIAPGGTRALFSNGQTTQQFDLATRTFSTTSDPGAGGPTFALVVYGGWSAARGTETYGSPATRRRPSRR